MKLEEGMYVRHKPLLSSTYIKINKIKEIEEKENCLHVWLEDKDLVTEKYIIKASYNIINLIEVGDYVNDLKVHGITDYGLEVYMFGDAHEILEENEIKTIVTKEQFSQMEYKIGGNE